MSWLARGEEAAKVGRMISRLLGLALIAGGLWVAWLGYQRSESIVGVAEGVGASVVNVWDGGARQPKHVWYYLGGAAMTLVGLGLLMRGSRD